MQGTVGVTVEVMIRVEVILVFLLSVGVTLLCALSLHMVVMVKPFVLVIVVNSPALLQ